MVIVLTIVHIIVCVFLVIVVLLQSGKAADLAGAFGGMGSQTAFGPRGSATFLSKATTGAAAAFMVTSLSLAILATRSSGGATSVLDKSKPKTSAPAQTAPAPQAPAQQAPAQQQPPTAPPTSQQQTPSGQGEPAKYPIQQLPGPPGPFDPSMTVKTVGPNGEVLSEKTTKIKLPEKPAATPAPKK